MEILFGIIAYGLFCTFLGFHSGLLWRDYKDKKDQENLEY